MCVTYMDWHLSPYCWQPFSMLGEWTAVPLENDKVVLRQVSTFINTIFVSKYDQIWQGLGKAKLKCSFCCSCLERILISHLMEGHQVKKRQILYECVLKSAHRTRCNV